MLTYLEVQAELSASSWDKAIINRFLPLLPRLGQESLHFLSTKIKATASMYIAEDILSALTMFDGLAESVAKNGGTEYLLLLKQAKDEHKFEFGRFILPIILDIRLNNNLSSKINAELSAAMDIIELKFFDELPLSEVLNIIRSRVVWYTQNSNFFMEVKRYYYYNSDIDGNDNALRQQLISALESNNEEVSGPALFKSNPAASPTIQALIEDFNQASSSERFKGGAYNVAKYLQNGLNFSILQPSQKSRLSEILLLENWLLHPLIDINEIKEYERELYRADNPDINIAVPGVSLIDTSDTKIEYSRKQEQLTNKQLKSMQDIAGKAPSVDYNNQKNKQLADALRLSSKGPRGLAMNQHTNINVEDEEKRLQNDREEKQASIEQKLAELRKRRQK